MISINEAVESFLLAKEADGLSKHTVAWYRYMLMRLCQQLGGVPLTRLSADLLRRYVLTLRNLQLSHETLRSHVRAMKTVLTWAWEEYELSGRCPADRIKKPSQQQPLPRAVEVADIRLLLKACEPTAQGYRDRAIIMFLADTGCRAAGLLGLTLSDVDLTKRVAVLREKGDRERIVPFTTHTATAIREWLLHRPRGAQQLFCGLKIGRHGSEFTTNGLRLMLNRLKRKANIRGRVNPHSFRHAFARHYLSAGGDLATLSQILGHRDITTTANFYTRYSTEELAVTHSRFSPIGQMFRRESGDD